MASEAVAAPAMDSAEPAPAAAKGKKAAKGKAEKAKSKGREEQAAKGKGMQEQAPEGAPSVLAHPRAMRSIARAKGWAGLIGFLLAGYMALPTSTVAEAGLHALIGGVVSYVFVWGIAVFAWRRLVMLELKGRQAQLLADLEKAATARLGPGAPPASGDRP